MLHKNRFSFATTVFLLLISGFGLTLSAANLSVSEFELITRGQVDMAQGFTLQSIGNFSLNIDGGAKFGADLGFNFTGDHLEDPLITAGSTLTFSHARAKIIDVFGLPLDITYFVGNQSRFCSGRDFPLLFGSEPIMTDFRGFFYFPDGVIYEGIYELRGTGIEFFSPMGTDNMAFFLYGYQNNHLPPGNYSGDIRYLLDTPSFKMEATIGGTWPQGTYGHYQGGLLFHISADDKGAFLAQIGVPVWNPRTALNQEMFFFLIEPRIHFGFFSIIPTLFRHPAYYNQTETGEAGSTDVNFNFKLGNLNDNGLTGGLETFFNTSAAQETVAITDQFTAKVSPYMSFVEGGSIWTIKLNFKVFPYSLPELFELFVGVKGGY